MLHHLISTEINPQRAMQSSRWLWCILAAVWLVLSFAMKSVKRSETIRERIQHIAPLLVAFWLLFNQPRYWQWLNLRLLPNAPIFWRAGVAITAAGVAISIWARLSLGSNWSGMVTLKDNHELIRTGLYSRIRHPIYTGILLAFVGTASIQGELRCLVGFAILLITLHFKAKREEGFLDQEFGPNFAEHFSRTGMFLPKLTQP
jgi:protein-S-isoprenylcysteine O-methyltransferase Ste14